MRYANIIIKSGGKRKTIRLEILTSERRKSPISGEDVTVITGYKVNKHGEYVGKANVDEVQIIIGDLVVKELEEDYKYGELVPVGTASQHQDEANRRKATHQRLPGTQKYWGGDKS